MENVVETQPTASGVNDAARHLAERVDEIIERWKQRVRREVAYAHAESQPDLIDTLPQYVKEISIALATRGDNRDKLEETCRAHAAERSQSVASSLESLLSEYTILHEVILDVLEHDG